LDVEYFQQICKGIKTNKGEFVLNTNLLCEP